MRPGIHEDAYKWRVLIYDQRATGLSEQRNPKRLVTTQPRGQRTTQTAAQENPG